MEPTKPAKPAAPVCCGQHATYNKGKPLVLACKLCPNSPTYWRRAES